MNRPIKAFPFANDADKQYNWIEKGMDLRDYFAAKAMQTLIHTCRHYEAETPVDRRKKVVALSWKFADDMMRARDERLSD